MGVGAGQHAGGPLLSAGEALTRDALSRSRFGVFRRAGGWREPVDLVLHDYQAGRDLLREQTRPNEENEGENRWEQWRRFLSMKQALVRGGSGAERVRREIGG